MVWIQLHRNGGNCCSRGDLGGIMNGGGSNDVTQVVLDWQRANTSAGDQSIVVKTLQVLTGQLERRLGKMTYQNYVHNCKAVDQVTQDGQHISDICKENCR